jgi:hypothetical protein
MAKAYTFTTRHYLTKDLPVLDLQEIAKVRWELVNTRQFNNEHSDTTPQILFF